tara:strand:- start:66 stop:545 length:480 start_codon:yes stop_codon:yes gene_type:complete
MSGKRYPEEFKIEAVKQVVDRGYSVADVAKRLDITRDIVLNALLMAVWRRNPKQQVMIHSDQGSQYTSHDWQTFLKANGLEGSMSRRGNCHDNAVAESFFQLLKRERIKRKIYSSTDDARSEIFDYIEMFYNSKRKHGSNNLLSPVEYENRYQERLRSV